MIALPCSVLSCGQLDTENFGASIAEFFLSDTSTPRFIALDGDLGAGKTTFVRGFARVFSPQSMVKSPSYTIVNEYRQGTIPIFHFDFYRLENEEDLESIGFFDYLDNGICIVEWFQKIPSVLPDPYLKITISRIADDPQKRQISAELHHISPERKGDSAQ